MKKLTLAISLAVAALAGCNDEATQPGPQPAGDATPAMQATATGTVESIDATGDRIVISHGPVPALDWPAMTMGFKATAEQAASVQVGQQVDFGFTMHGPEATLTRIDVVTAPATPTPPAP